MRQIAPNLLSTLHRLAHRQHENFTTEAFVWTMQTLIAREPDLARSFLSWLCFGREDQCVDGCAITTQRAVEEGTPDIWVESARTLVLIEVKTISSFGENQVGRYLRSLSSRAAGRQSRLVVLTPDLPELSGEEFRLVRAVRWYEVAQKLRLMHAKSPATQHVLDQFVEFLKETVMTVERVGWELASGVEALTRLAR